MYTNFIEPFKDGIYTTSSFADVSTDAWYFQPVEAMRQLYILSGYDETINGEAVRVFKPNQPITRAEAATLLSTIRNVNPQRTHAAYNDIPEDAWFKDTVYQAASLGYFRYLEGALSSLYTVISVGSVFTLTSALSFSCTTTADIKYCLVTFIEMMEYFDPPEIVKELRLDIFLDLLREELVAHSIFDKDYLNYLLCGFETYKDFVDFSKTVKIPDYQFTIPFCMLLLQDFTAGDITKFIFRLICEFCEMKDANFKKVVEKFDKLNKKTKSKAINTQRTLAKRKKNTEKRTVIEVNPYE